MPKTVIARSVPEVWSVRCQQNESRSLGVERKSGGNLHQRLNIDERSIANKYREGKLKSTSKGELKYLKSLKGKRLFVIRSSVRLTLPTLLAGVTVWSCQLGKINVMSFRRSLAALHHPLSPSKLASLDILGRWSDDYQSQVANE